MNSLQAEYFLELCKHMNFTRAAESLYVSQPAVSKQISAMEKEMGVVLFERTYKSLRLTEAGEILRDAFIEMSGIYTGALNRAKQLNAENKGRLAIGMLKGWSASRVLLPDIMGQMRANHPNVLFSMQNLQDDGLLEQLQKNQLDVVFSYSSVYERGKAMLDHTSIRKVNMRLFYSSACYNEDSEPTFLDFRHMPFLLFPEIEKMGLLNEEKLKNLCVEHGFLPQIKHVPNLESALSSVESGLGVVLLDELHKINYNPMFFSIDLPMQTNMHLIWKRVPDNPMTILFVNEYQLLIS